MKTAEEILNIESSQRQHHEELLFQERLCAAITQTDYVLFATLKPKFYKDGNQWCVLYGEDIQSGIAGFGDTLFAAIVDWDGAFQHPLKKQNGKSE